MRTRKIQKCRIVCFDRPRCDGVSETDINLDRYLSFVQKRGKSDAHAFMVCVFFDAFCLDSFRVKAQGVVREFKCREFLEYANKSLWGAISCRQKISVAGWTMPFLCPEFK